MGEFDRKDDGFLQRRLGALQARDVVPFHVGFLGEDRARETSAEFLEIRVLIVVATVFAFATDGARGAVGADGPARSFLVLRLEVFLERFGAREILFYLGPDEKLGLLVLLVCGKMSGKRDVRRVNVHF